MKHTHNFTIFVYVKCLPVKHKTVPHVRHMPSENWGWEFYTYLSHIKHFAATGRLACYTIFVSSDILHHDGTFFQYLEDHFRHPQPLRYLNGMYWELNSLRDWGGQLPGGDRWFEWVFQTSAKLVSGISNCIFHSDFIARRDFLLNIPTAVIDRALLVLNGSTFPMGWNGAPRQQLNQRHTELLRSGSKRSRMPVKVDRYAAYRAEAIWIERNFHLILGIPFRVPSTYGPVGQEQALAARCPNKPLENVSVPWQTGGDGKFPPPPLNPAALVLQSTRGTLGGERDSTSGAQSALVPDR